MQTNREPLTERVTVELGAALHRDLAQWAIEEDRPVSNLARRRGVLPQGTL